MATLDIFAFGVYTESIGKERDLHACTAEISWVFGQTAVLVENDIVAMLCGKVAK